MNRQGAKSAKVAEEQANDGDSSFVTRHSSLPLATLALLASWRFNRHPSLRYLIVTAAIAATPTGSASSSMSKRGWWWP